MLFIDQLVRSKATCSFNADQSAEQQIKQEQRKESKINKTAKGF